MTNQQLTPIKAFSMDLAKEERGFQSVLPAHIPVKKFMRTVVGAVQNNPDILNCKKQSILLACQKAAQDGLILDGREAALIKFGDTATYMPMVAGILKKLRNSGQLSTIDSVIVHEHDEFSYNPGTGALVHNPDWFGDRGIAIGVYAVANLKDGGQQVSILNKVQLAKIRKSSRSSGRGPWVDWEEEMWQKSALKKLAKLLPSSADTDQVWDHDNDNYDPDIADKNDTRTPEKTVDEINAELDGVDDPVIVDKETGEVLDAEFTESPEDEEEDLF